MAQQTTEADENRTTNKKFTAAFDADGLATELDRENPVYCLAEGDEVTLVYDSPYTDAEETTWTGTVARTGTSRGGELTTYEVQDDEGEKAVKWNGKVVNGEGRSLGTLLRVEAARPQDITEMLEAAAEGEDDDQDSDPERPMGDRVGCLCCGFSYDDSEYDACPVCESGDCTVCGEDEDEQEDGGEGSALTCDVEWCGGVREGTTGYCSQHQDEDEQEDEQDTEDWDSDDWAQVNQHPSENNHYVSTTGNITRHCPRCGYEGTHDHPRRSRPTYHADLTHHCPHAECGARLHSGPAAECEDCGHEDEDDEDDEAEVATDGGFDSALEAEGGLAEDGGQQPDMAGDGGQVDEKENPHRHRGVWAAAQNLETHEDGSHPRIGVEYRKKNGNGTARKAGTVERVEVERPDEQFGHEVGQPVPRIVFTRDDGQRMYVEPDGLYTVGSHAPYVGAIVALTTSTTSTVALPEASGEREDSSDDGEDEVQASAPRVDSLEDLAEWVERQDSDLHAEVGTTHYSWDIPGFGRNDDPHSGRTAKRGGECAYLEVRGPRSERVEKALALLAHQEDLEVSAGHHRATLVPPSGW